MEKGRGWGVLLVSCECCCDWIVSGGHDLRMGCHWASRAPPRPGPSFPSNSRLPSHTTHKCTCTHKIDTHTHTHTHILYTPTLPTVHPPPSILSSTVFQRVSVCVFFFSSYQCNMSTNGQRGECWCVDPETGVELLDTPRVRGDPNC